MGLRVRQNLCTVVRNVWRSQNKKLARYSAFMAIFTNYLFDQQVGNNDNRFPKYRVRIHLIRKRGSENDNSDT